MALLSACLRVIALPTVGLSTPGSIRREERAGVIEVDYLPLFTEGASCCRLRAGAWDAEDEVNTDVLPTVTNGPFDA